MRQRNHARSVRTPVLRRRRHRHVPGGAQEVGLRILADEQREFYQRPLGKQGVEPKLRAFAPWRHVAAPSAPWVAVAHGQYRHALFVVEDLGIKPHPVAQTLAAPIVPRNAARMHFCAGRLSDDKNSRRGTGLKDRTRSERQMRIAGPTFAHDSEQVIERSIDPDRRAFGKFIGCDLTSIRSEDGTP